MSQAELIAGAGAAGGTGAPVRARHYIEYWAVRFAVCELMQLPMNAAISVSDRFGLLIYKALKGRSRTGRENIAAAFPELGPDGVEALLKEVYRNLGRTVAEVFHMRKRLRADNWREFFEIENVEAALDVCLAGRGGILVTGHLGNWELLGHVMPYIGIRSQVLARPLDNPLLDRYILGVRESGLQRIVLKRGSGALIESTLAGGGFVSILADQDAGRKGAFVPFFGRSASTWRSPALLALKTGAPILPGCCVRTDKPGRFRIIVGAPIYADPSGDVAAETLRITRAFTAQLESWARDCPGQYLWLHRRWKSVPGARSLVASGK